MTAKPATEIKNAIASHLRRHACGETIYGLFEFPFFDGQENRSIVIDVHRASRFERYGTITIYHPVFGKWVANLLSDVRAGTPRQAFTADEIRENLKTAKSADFIYRVYGGEPIESEPVLWDPYWQKG